MFWRKRKTHEYEELSPVLHKLATRLGLERRKNVRVRYPPRQIVCKLPEISFDAYMLRVHDVSIGGCCLLDPQEVLGPSVGQDVELTLHWTTGAEDLRARIVSRVDHRRHIQFLDLPDYRREQMEKSMAVGVRGLGLSRHDIGVHAGATVEAAEMWSSLLGDSVILERDLHRVAQIQLEDALYIVHRQAWPTREGHPISRSEFEKLILFLANAPGPTAGMKELLTALEDLLAEPAR